MAHHTLAAGARLGCFARGWASIRKMRSGCEPPCLKPRNRGGSAGYHRCLGNVLAARRHHRATSEARGGKNIVDCANRRGPGAARDMLGGAMKMKRRLWNEAPSVLDVVALLADYCRGAWRAARSAPLWSNSTTRPGSWSLVTMTGAPMPSHSAGRPTCWCCTMFRRRRDAARVGHIANNGSRYGSYAAQSPGRTMSRSCWSVSTNELTAPSPA